MGYSATAKRLTLVSELACVTTHFDLPSSPHSVTDFLQAQCDLTENGCFAFLIPTLGA